MVYFDKRGADNTEETLRISKEAAEKRGIKYIVLASTSGNTGLQAAKLLQGTDINLIIVAHSTGHREPGLQQFDKELKKECESLGAVVFIGTDALTGFATAMRKKERFTDETLIGDVLRMFGSGTKVGVEIVAMASDADLLPIEDVIAVAGSGRGSDTSLIIGANSTNQFFDIKIKEVLAKPREF